MNKQTPPNFACKLLPLFSAVGNRLNFVYTGFVVALSETLRSELKPHGVDVTVKMTTFYTSDIAEFTRGSPADREKARSFVQMAPWNSEAMADSLLLHVQSRKFDMVAPAQARFLWRFKRLLPEAYLRLVPALFSRLEAKLLARATARNGKEIARSISGVE